MNEEIQHPVLGIDHGEARIGLAITDPVGIMAHPLETIQVKTTDPIERIIALVSTRQVKQLVLGLPLRMDGSEGTAAEKIRAFGRELAEKIGATAYLIADADCIQQVWLKNAKNIGVTAGASAPEVLVQGVVNRLKEWGATNAIERAGREENIEFAVPKELRVRNVS